MDTRPFPPPANLNLSTHVQMTEHGYEHAMLKSLLASAHATGDRTFRVFRLGEMTLRMDPSFLIDRLALRQDWVSLRSNSHTLIVRAAHLFGIIEATGSPEKCSLSVQLWTDTAERGDAARESILTEFRPCEFRDISFSLNWRFLDGKGQIARASTEERASANLLDEAYPPLGDLKAFIDQYLEAPETVLVLQGSPGTGKTRLIRAILGAISERAGDIAEVLYTGDSAVLESDEVFLEFITASHKAFVVEDADHLLKPRSGGNQTLHRFLNIADGIASAHGKKIIFSTNLPNLRDIDEALVRPGRCFAHVLLQELHAAEAVALLDRLCAATPERRVGAIAALNVAGQKRFSVAEVYAAHRNAGPQRGRLSPSRFCAARDSDRVAFGFN
jgi:energy-coupling factor transporter ATP-binding protein EcfA2